jgi:hypothetical protein
MLFRASYFFLANSLSDTVPAWRTLGSEKDIHPNPGSDECPTLQRKWLHDCLTKHEECHLQTQIQVPRRIVSIGLDNMSLRVVETQGTESLYAALSHCWGAKQPLITTTSTLHLRKTNLNWDSMPATFQDAVRVTRGLGIRYLWIDSLCIIQDDTADWESESTKMGAIYQAAQIVIAASASADPDVSFLALRRTPYAKPLELQYERQDGGYSTVKARPLLEEFPSIEPLDTRAWTFQEQWLSRRLLRYCSGELRWRCRKKRRCECQTFHLTAGHRYESFQSCPSPSSTAWHYLINWYAMVRVYSIRKLTRRSDKLPAISGMAAIVSEKISSPYVAGLWKDTLLFDLQWETFPSLSKEEHRSLRASRIYLAPTFSWVSIDSQTEYENGGGQFKPIDTDVMADAIIVDVQITLKGLNPFGEAIDGFLISEGPLVSATLSDWEYRSVGDCEGLSYELKHGSKTEIMQADLPLTEGVCINSLGQLEPTAKRASHDDMILHIEKSPVWCLSVLRRLDDSRFVLILGLSARVPGAYERLGICRFLSTSSFQGGESLSSSWFDDACRATVKIV